MGQIVGNLAQAKQYKAQGRIALAEGRAKKAQAYKQAYNTEEEARADSYIAGKNMMRTRENQTGAVASIRNQQGSSGFTREGSGRQAEIAVAEQFEKSISDMALSNAISDSNKRYEASVARYQGDMYMRQAELTNSYYNTLAKNAKTSALIQGISSVAGSAISYGIGHTEKDINGNEYQVSSITDAQRGWNSFYDLSGSGLSLVPGTQNTANNKGVASSVWDMLSSLYDKK